MEPNNTEYKMPTPQRTGAPHRIVTSGIIVFLILILGALLLGLYFWSTSLTNTLPATDFTTRPTAEENNEPESTTAEAVVETLQAVSTSNEIDAIRADLEATSIPDVTADFAAVEAELRAAQ